jgi:transcription initiation factor TFIIIB Brf1 subunit/transcription initiation factor TFIIB
MLPKAAPVGFQALAPGQRMSDYARCRNPTCNSTSFDNDARGGDRVCNQCGVVQNVRSIENLEEEHRSFNDDDGKSEAKKRVERVSHDGRLVAKIGGNDAMRRIHAAATAEGEGEKSKKDQEKLDELKSKIARLCGIDTSIDSESKQDAYHLADVLVNSEIAHRERCWDPKCRLAGKIAAPVIVAGGILHEALRERGFGRGFEEIAFLVQKSEDGERSRAANVTPKQIGEATEKVLKMCLYQQTFQGAYYTCCPRIKIVKVSAILRNSGAILRNSGAILAQFWRNSAQFWRNYSDAPTSLVKAHDTENDVFLCEMAGGVLPWRDEAERTPQGATAPANRPPTPVRGGWEQVPPSVSTEPGFGKVVDVGGARQFLLKIDTKDAEKKRASLEPGAYNYIASFNTGPGTAKPYRFDTSTKTGVNNIDPTKAVRLGIDDPEKIAEETTNLETAEIAEKFGKNTVGLVPRVCERLFGIQNNAHSVRHRAEQIVNKWCTDGIDAMMPHTVAACAILTSHMEKKGQLTSMGFSYPPWLQSIGTDGRPQFDENKFEAKLAETAGIAVATLRTRYKKLLEEHPV